ncbi:hypothetical protein ETI11_01240 [Macrococcoides canis]|uniref:Uncharacterized protein n=1 Tax=Macrococcoides canis TaxID=1855823 RepID=A0A4V3BG73_9STAP|nr:hypothetical protein [Macrococcus canis]TDM18085.1 hypothetical protein ETI04_00940 [Macrococcus canis]TDM38044.1 hypothetical protein ETI11_01240 [Macrococcus canis]TDM43486.1 hypothetical protein ETI09_03680 [Macrococcus canis]
MKYLARLSYASLYMLCTFIACLVVLFLALSFQMQPGSRIGLTVLIQLSMFLLIATYKDLKEVR